MTTTIVINGVQVQVDPGVAEAVLALAALPFQWQPRSAAFPAVRGSERLTCTVVMGPATSVMVLQEAGTPEVHPVGSADAAAVIRALVDAATAPTAPFDPAELAAIEEISSGAC